MKSGIYMIKNIVNDKIYIGSSVDIPHRISSHKSYLKRGKHANKILQRSWNKYGGDNFKFEQIAKCPSEYLIKLEQWFMDSLKPAYNIRIVAHSNKGLPITQEQRIKISLALKGRKGYIKTREQIEKQRLKLLGRKATDEQRKKISLALKGKPKSKEHIEKVRLAHLGRKYPNRIISEETILKKKLSAKRGADNHKSKKIQDSNLNKIWDTLIECSTYYNENKNNMSRYLRGVRKNKYPHLKYI